MKPLDIIIQRVPLAKCHSCNPWGDYDEAILISTRNPEKADAFAMRPPEAFFRINRETGFLSPMTEEQFRESCIATVLNNSEKPALLRFPCNENAATSS